ncbi:S8 family serine peptidase [Thiohalobacter sp.]|uniref:S8 family serine peptidase n=1 Tax=Thiohalobacter sp. TaxID=2025948 RepID=UPI00261FC155|nr:S8 family serine peptidase [Thiohalobacter sp.]
MRNLIEAQGGRLRFSSERSRQLEVPAGALSRLLAVLPPDTRVRLPFPHEPLAVTSQGVAIQGAADFHALGVDGGGVRIGVIDLGFASLAASQASGDLPANLVITDYTGTGNGGTTHGTQVAEILYDMAPGAQFYLAKVSTDLELSQAVNDMLAAGVRIINHSVAWYGAAFYDGTGPLCGITDTAEQGGALWVNAAGNSRTKHWLGQFSDADGDLRHEFSSGQNWNSLSLNAGQAVTLVLNWDAYPVTGIDYDLHLYDGDPDAGGNLVASSTNRQRGTPSSVPYEAIDFTAATAGTYYLVVTKRSASTADVPLSLFSLGPSLDTRVQASSLVQPADCASVIAVGAVNLSDGAEGFSSEGPTTDGRAKPEIAGTDRVQTSLSGSFAGTSAASPHVAGGAALLLARNPGWSVASLRAELTATAEDVAGAGFDYRTGQGRLSLDADGDGWNHDTDNCPLIANAAQVDTDGDLAGDACDGDDDNDGLSDVLELAIGSNPLVLDSDGDGLDDYFEVAFDGDATGYVAGQDLSPVLADTDGDGLSDAAELAWDGDPAYNPGADLDPLSGDTDGDGLPDGSDPVPLLFNYADGDLAPPGAPDGVLDAGDLLLARQLVLGERAAAALDLSHGDLYPPGAPDGVIDLSDLVLIQQRLGQ